MKVEVEVILRNQVSIPINAKCKVEIRDVSLLDAPSKTICSHQSRVTEISGVSLLNETLEFSEVDIGAHNLNVWAHLSLSGTDRIQAGDYITMQAYPLTNINSTTNFAKAVVELQRVP